MKIFSTLAARDFSRQIALVHPILFPPALLFALFFASFGATSAQIQNSYRLKFVDNDNVVLGATRPRVINAKTENESNGTTKISRATILEYERTAFRLINEKRAAQNLAPLEWSEEVARVARAHSENMAEYKFLSHQGTDGSMVDDRADRIGLRRWRAIGENIAYNRGYAQPIEFAVERWMLSPKHKQNLLDSRWRESGIGIAVAPDGTYYLTQVFLLRK